MATPVEWLNEFQVNTGTADVAGISDPQVVGLAGGNYLVAWVEAGTTGVGTTAGADVIGKIFDAEGNLVRDSFRVNTNFNGDDEDDFDIAATNDGGFMIVYVDDSIGNANAEAIRWERHDDNGDLLNTITVATNSVAADVLSNPKIVVNNDDNSSYVTFTDNVGAGADEIRAVRLDSSGTVLTAEFDAGANTAGQFSRDAEAAINTNGELVTAYEEDDGGFSGIELMVRNTAGVQQHNVNVVTGSATVSASDPHVATLANGNIVVAYVQGNDVKYRVYDQNLVPDPVGGGPFNVDTSSDVYNEPHVTALPQGGFVITWDNDTANTLQARRFNDNGSVSGTDTVFTLEPAAGTEVNPNVAALADGRILFSWEENDNVFSSIWDTRGGNVDANDYDGLPLNFVETDLTTTNVIDTTLTGDSDGDTILGQGGDDSITGGSSVDSIDGGAGNDTLEGGFSTDTVNGGSGNDLIIVNDGEFIDDVDGGSGSDTLDLSDMVGFGESVNVDLKDGIWSGLGGTQTIAGIEVVEGTQENDVLAGKSDSVLNGGDGDDTILFRSGDGFPDYNGEAGIDTADFTDFASTDMFVDLAAGGYRFGSTTPGAFSGDLLNFENYEGSGGIDNVIGTSGDNTMTGNGGDDTLNGGAGNDLLNGGDGADLLIAGTGNDTLNGDAGDDRMRGNSGLDQMFGGTGNDRMDGASGGDIMDGGDGIDTVEGEGGNDTITGGGGDDIVRGGGGFDVVSGGTGNDRVEGNSGDDTVNGNSGDDDVSGGGGNDVLIGSTGNDTLNGNSGDDNISGGSGDDSLLGSSGDDTLNGGTGSDTFIGGRGADQMTGGAQSDNFIFAFNADADQITDFQDNLDILSIDDNLYTGTLTAADIVSTFGSNIAGGVELDFGGGDVIEVLGAGVTTASIVDDILIV